MRKITLYGKDAREKILAGINKIADAVAVTLGPQGRCVLISQSMVVDYGVHSLPIEVSKDGYRVTQRFDIDDPFEKSGILLVKECAQKSVDQSGDGTTSSVILMRAMVAEGIAAINEGANPVELKKAIDKAVEYVVSELKKGAVQIGHDNQKVFQIASISANNDPAIGRMIADAFRKIGNEGMIDIEAGKSVETEIKIADGYRFERSFISPWFMNDREKQICEFENPLILLYEKMVTHHTQIERALTLSIQQGRPILIICEDSKEEGLGYLIRNTLEGRVKCCVVKAPSFGELRRDDMEDLAILTGGSYISDSKGVGIAEIEFENLGQARKIIVTKDETTIIGGNANSVALENLLNELRMNLAQAKNENEKSPIEKRIAKLTGGVAVIQVGAPTETEMKEKLDRFDDAVRATKAAISEGFIVGGATAFLRMKSGNEIVDKAMASLFKQICLNAGVDHEALSIAVLNQEGNIGYNAKTDKVEDLVEAGVIDPVKVLRCAIQNAASSASMVLTTECLIADTL